MLRDAVARAPSTSSRGKSFLDRVGIEHPILQAPMAGTSTAAMAAAVSNAGALGGLAVSAMTAAQASATIAELASKTSRPFNVNVFCHAPPVRDAARELAWIERLRPTFETYGASPPRSLGEIYRSFRDDDAMLEVVLDARPAVVSFHFGVPDAARIARLRAVGSVLVASVTSVDEARVALDAGCDALVAQGHEAGGHRGVFDPRSADARLSVHALIAALTASFPAVPVIAAGGIMDGADVARALDAGAVAAQIGTAFVVTDESAADAAHRAAVLGASGTRTVMTSVISGRPARCVSNRFTEIGADVEASAIPDYPVAYDAGKALNAAAKAAGEAGFGAQWAGEGAPRARPMSARSLVQTLVAELARASASS